MNAAAAPSSPPRPRLLEGAPFFRDLGGLATVDGRRVRAGRVYRSCGLMELTATDVATLRDTVRLRAVIDLRDASEAAEDEAGPLAALSLAMTRVPLIDLMVHGHVPRGRLIDRYCTYLRYGATRVRTVLERIAEADAHPLVYHCTAGKDRTGIVSAILLSALGVRREEIIADYSTDRASQAWLLEFLRRRAVQGPRLAAMPPEALDCAPETMQAFLEVMDAEYGDVRAYLESAGADARLVARLEAALLEPGA